MTTHHLGLIEDAFNCHKQLLSGFDDCDELTLSSKQQANLAQYIDLMAEKDEPLRSAQTNSKRLALRQKMTDIYLDDHFPGVLFVMVSMALPLSWSSSDSNKRCNNIKIWWAEKRKPIIDEVWFRRLTKVARDICERHRIPGLAQNIRTKLISSQRERGKKRKLTKNDDQHRPQLISMGDDAMRTAHIEVTLNELGCFAGGLDRDARHVLCLPTDGLPFIDFAGGPAAHEGYRIQFSHRVATEIVMVLREDMPEL